MSELIITTEYDGVGLREDDQSFTLLPSVLFISAPISPCLTAPTPFTLPLPFLPYSARSASGNRTCHYLVVYGDGSYSGGAVQRDTLTLAAAGTGTGTGSNSGAAAPISANVTFG